MSTAYWQCPACGYQCHGPWRDDRDAVAWHEAGHTLMRWLRLPATVGTTCIHPDGSGFSDTARPGADVSTEDALLITIAGPVAEVGLLGETLNVEESRSDDLTAIFALLTPTYVHGALGGHMTQREAFDHYWQRAFTALWQAFDTLEALAEGLRDDAVLTAADIREICGDAT
jgi:hypothetical protein